MSLVGDAQAIYQIFLSDDRGQDPLAIKYFADNRQSFLSCYPDYKFHLLNDDDVLCFMQANFDSDVVSSYQSIVPYAYKKDLASYCIMLAHGGIFSDLVMRAISPIVLGKDKSIVCFRDAFSEGAAPWAVSNGLMAAVPGREEFRTCIGMITQNCRNQYYGASSLHPTGPALLGRALALSNTSGALELGRYEALTDGPSTLRFGYSAADGRLIAIRMKPDGGHIDGFGLTGTNSYNEFWRNRSVYRNLDRDQEGSPNESSAPSEAMLLYEAPLVVEDDVVPMIAPWDHAIVFSRICSTLSPQIICDIGAFDGSDTRLFAEGNPGSRIVAFEACPENYFDYFLSVDHPEVRASVQHMAISDSDGVAELTAPDPPADATEDQRRERRGMASLLKRADLPGGRTFLTTTRRLDSFFQTLSTEATLALWVDVEGNTRALLDGAASILPQVIVLKLELETIEYWQGQALDEEINRRAFRSGFRMIAKSDPSVGQYDAIFLRAGLESDEIKSIVDEFTIG